MIPLPPIMLVTAPSDARVRSLAPVDTLVERGDIVAVLDAPRGPVSLRADTRGRIGGTLANADQTVAAGEGVVWIRR